MADARVALMSWVGVRLEWVRVGWVPEIGSQLECASPQVDPRWHQGSHVRVLAGMVGERYLMGFGIGEASVPCSRNAVG